MMPRFLQYNIKEILPVLLNFIQHLSNEENKKLYKKEELQEIYLRDRAFETKKTQAGLQNLIISILFEKEASNSYSLKKEVNLLIKNIYNEELLKQYIYSYLYDTVEIFRIECEIIFDIMEENPAQYEQNVFKELVLRTLEKLVDHALIPNAKKKINRTFRNLIEIGVLNKSDGEYSISPCNLDNYLFLINIFKIFKEKKISISLLRKRDFRKKFFLTRDMIEDYLMLLQKDNLIIIERRANLEQIDLLTDNLEELINNIINVSD